MSGLTYHFLNPQSTNFPQLLTDTVHGTPTLINTGCTFSNKGIPSNTIEAVWAPISGDISAATYPPGQFAIVGLQGNAIPPLIASLLSPTYYGPFIWDGVSWIFQRTVTITSPTYYVHTTQDGCQYNDGLVLVNCPSPCTISLPYQGYGYTITIKDISGSAATNHITIPSISGLEIDNSSTTPYIINKNFGSVTFQSGDMYSWWIIANYNPPS